jgi:carbamoyltransferase
MSSRILGINAIFHDPAAALVVDGVVVAAVEEERFNRRKHGKRPVPFAAWELPEEAARCCLDRTGLVPEDLDAVAYSYDHRLVRDAMPGLDEGGWEPLRTMYARRAPEFIATALPGLDPSVVQPVPHHVAHAASAALTAPFGDTGPANCAVLVLDGRGEAASHLAGVYRGGQLTVLASQELPHSLGYLYEECTAHLGYVRSSDEYKVMAMASYGRPRFLDVFREHVRVTAAGEFNLDPIDWSSFPARRPGEEWSAVHADLAASVQTRLEEVILDLACWLFERSGDERLAVAGGVALNCVANTRLFADSPFREVWVPPAAGDAGTAMGAALELARLCGGHPQPLAHADLGPDYDEPAIERALMTAPVEVVRSTCAADEVAASLARDELVGWFQGRAEYGARALGHRSLLAHPGHRANLDRLNAVKGREGFRPIAPMVLVDRAPDIFTRGPLPSPHMCFVHDVVAEWRPRISAFVHVDGTARVQTVDPSDEPLLAELLAAFEARTGLPVLANTSLNTGGRPIVNTPEEAVELLCCARMIDLLAIGPFLVRRSGT